MTKKTKVNSDTTNSESKKSKIRKRKETTSNTNSSKPKTEKKPAKKFNRIRFFKAVVFFGTLAAVFTWLFWGIPLPTQLSSQSVPVSTKLYDRKGELLYEIYSDKRSTPVVVEEIPEYVVNATLAIEDKDFYKHSGVSFIGISRAFYNTMFKGKLQGGSTLTQQLIKNTLLTTERTVKRKVREFALTLVVESIYTKKQILSMYLNQIPYGGTAYGIGAASEIYFGKEANKLTLSEAALLAGLTQAPSRYSPFGARPELAKGRQRAVLDRMVEDGYITQEEADNAYDEDLQFVQNQDIKAPHFSLWVKEILAEKYGDTLVERGGLRVTTSLDMEVQNFAEQAVASEVAKLKRQRVGNGAAIVTRPKTGEILAMVGSKDYNADDEDGKVNIIFAERQPGSSIKPLNYALAIKDQKITAATPFADVPTCFVSAGTRGYCPRNYDGSFHGAVQVRYALANSYNIPAVRTLAINGIENFIEFSRELGITTFNDPSRYGLSLTLGGGEVRPFDMATAFGVFANRGIKQELNPLLKVEDYKGNILEEYKEDKVKLSGPRVLESDVPFIISHILADNGARSAAFGSRSFLNVSGHPEVSVKTGTTNDRKDNWTIGYSDKLLVLVWVGNNDNTPMSGAVSGLSGASPIWNSITKFTLDMIEEGKYSEDEIGHSKLTPPQGVVGANICQPSGNLPSQGENEGCSTRFEYFIKGKVGAGLQTGRTDVFIDKTTGAEAIEGMPPDQVEVQQKAYLLDPLGTLICTECPIASKSATISYPLKVNTRNTSN